jgi:hypothetical protein
LITAGRSKKAASLVSISIPAKAKHGLTRNNIHFDDRLGAEKRPHSFEHQPEFLNGFSPHSHAARLPVGNITAYASSGMFLPRLEYDLDRLYQSMYCIIDRLASVTES